MKFPLINKLFNSLKKLVNYAENFNISISHYLIIFLSISFFRNFVEGALESSKTIGTSAGFETTILQMGLLFNLEWMTLFCALALVIYYFTKTSIVSILKILLFAFIWIITVPFVDMALYFPVGCKIDYLFTFKDYMKALAFFFVPGVDAGVCAGIRIEVFASFIFCGSYVYFKSKNIIKAISASLLLYFLAVSSMAYPVFILIPFAIFTQGGFDIFINNFFYGSSYGGEFIRRNSVMIFVLLTPLIIWLYSIFSAKENIKKIISQLLSPRALIYVSVFVCGFFLSPKQSALALFSNPFDFFLLLSGSITVFIFFLYSETFDLNSVLTPYAPLLLLLILISSMALSSATLLFYIFLIVITVFYKKSPFYLINLPIFKYTYTAIVSFIIYCSAYYLMSGSSLFSYQAVLFPLLLFVILSLLFAGLNYPKNNFILSSLFISYVLIPPALSSYAMLIPAIAAAILTIICFYKINNSEKRLNTQLVMLIIFISYLAITIK